MAGSLEMPAASLTPAKITSEFRRKILAWYYVHGYDYPWRNKGLPLYPRIIAEVMLQRTRALTVAKYLPGFICRFTSWKEVADATEEELREYLYPLGLWRSRVTTIKRLAAEMVRMRGHPPRNYAKITTLPGVGQYIANAITLFAFNERRPLLDTSMARVLERYFGPRKLADIRDDPYLQELAYSILRNVRHPIDINFAILDFAAAICTIDKPRCKYCPLSNRCKHYKEQVTA